MKKMIPVYSIFRSDSNSLDTLNNINLLKNALSGSNCYYHRQGLFISLHLPSETEYDKISEIEDAIDLISITNPGIKLIILFEDDTVEYREILNGTEVANTTVKIREKSNEQSQIVQKILDYRFLKLSNSELPKRLIIDDSFILESSLADTKFYNKYNTIVDREVHKFESRFYAACDRMYHFLHKENILQNIAFEYEEELLEDGRTKIYFALDSKDLEPYDIDMADSGVDCAELVTEYLTGKRIFPKSDISWTSMFTAPMKCSERKDDAGWGCNTLHESECCHLDMVSINRFLTNAQKALACDDEDLYIDYIKKAVSKIYEQHKKGIVVEISENLIRDSKKTKGMKSVSIPLKESETKWSYLEVVPENICPIQSFDTSKKLLSLGKGHVKHTLSFKKDNKFVTKEVTSDELRHIIMLGKIEYAKEMNEKRQKERDAKYGVAAGNTLAAIPF